MIPLGLGLPALAATLTVGPGQTHTTLGSAISAAAAGDTIEVDPGEYGEQLTISKDLTIVGDPGGDVVWRNTFTNDVLTVTGGATVRIENVAFRATILGRAIDLADGDLTLVQVDVRGIRAYDRHGAAIRAQPGTSLTLESCELVDNSTGDLFDGGHLYAQGATVAIEGSLLAEGHARNGGAIALIDTRLTTVDGRWEGNSAADGGALSADGSVVVMTGTRLEDNRAEVGFGSGSGGGIRLFAGSIANLHAVNATGNSTDGDGGGIEASDAGTVTLTECALLGNRADGDGGGIRAAGSTVLQVADSLLDGNEAGNIGGALLLEAVDADVITSTFCGNAARYGGAVYERGERTRLANDVFQGNQAEVTGGAIRARDAVDLDVRNNTFVDNHAGEGGAMAAADSSVAFLNNVVAFHRDGGGVFAENTTGSISWSVFWQNTPYDLSANLLAAIGPDVLFVDPGFASISDDGTCNDDFGPGPGSPLIDAGDPALLDADGTRSDIGHEGGSVTLEDLDADLDGSPASVDCDDADATVYPGAAEDCTTVDRDCSGDPLDAVGVGTTYYEDRDGDGYGNLSSAITTCVAPEGYILQGGDCDDASEEYSPGNVDVCDGLDNDCDGVADNGPTGVAWWPDVDGDGFGAGAGGYACEPPAGTADNDLDCDDTSADVNPDADDVDGDGLDANCDGSDGEAPVDPVGEEGIKAGGECGCASRGGPMGGAWLLLLASALARRRR